MAATHRILVVGEFPFDYTESFTRDGHTLIEVETIAEASHTLQRDRQIEIVLLAPEFSDTDAAAFIKSVKKAWPETVIEQPIPSPAKLMSHLRRQLSRAQGDISLGDVSLDFSHSTVRVARREPVRPSTAQYKLLRLMIENAEEIVSYETILNLMGYQHRNAIATMISRLNREVLYPSKQVELKVVSGLGYRMSLKPKK